MYYLSFLVFAQEIQLLILSVNLLRYYAGMKTVLVTGARGGIGSAICTALTKEGYQVVPVTHADADLSKFDEVDGLRQSLVPKGKYIDWIVCAHGYLSPEKDLQMLSPEDIRATVDVNALSIIFIAKAFLPKLSPGGGIVAISSTTALEPSGYLSTYSASKAAVNSFMQSLARNLPEQKFITICPGATNAPMRRLIADDADQQQSPSVVASVVKQLVGGETDYDSGDVLAVKDGNVYRVLKQSM